jgi:phage-related protein
MGLMPVAFHGDSLERLRDFPEDARRQAGHELYLVQTGADPTDRKPMPTIGLACERSDFARRQEHTA